MDSFCCSVFDWKELLHEHVGELYTLINFEVHSDIMT